MFLVFELIVYYSFGYWDVFVYEILNGCVIGGSLEEVIFYGILEIVECDVFLFIWYVELFFFCFDLSLVNDIEL